MACIESKAAGLSLRRLCMVPAAHSHYCQHGAENPAREDDENNQHSGTVNVVCNERERNKPHNENPSRNPKFLPPVEMSRPCYGPDKRQKNSGEKRDEECFGVEYIVNKGPNQAYGNADDANSCDDLWHGVEHHKSIRFPVTPR
jgi:hypothetical protein